MRDFILTKRKKFRTIKMADPLFEPLLVNGPQLLQQDHGILDHIAFPRRQFHMRWQLCLIHAGDVYKRQDYVDGFAVATADEAMLLRRNGIQKMILILGVTHPSRYQELIENEIRPAIFTMAQAKPLSEACLLYTSRCV